MASEQNPLARIHELVDEERKLRDRLQRKEISADEEHARLRDLEVQLDQCWDLLRQRRALRETGGDPRQAQVRPPDEVEGYLN
jgi:predicted nuclease with TOPRIM domain